MTTATTAANGRRYRRCHSWRPVLDARGQAPHKAFHAPGTCRICWRPCFRRTTDGAQRCDQCVDLLVGHPSPWVRRALAVEPTAHVGDLEALSSDSDGVVAMAARWSLEHRWPSAHLPEDLVELLPVYDPDRNDDAHAVKAYVPESSEADDGASATATTGPVHPSGAAPANLGTEFGWDEGD